MDQPLEPWQHVWRDGLAPLLSRTHLEVLQRALKEDDPCLIQYATTNPPPLQCVEKWKVEGACALAYCGWQGDHLQTVGEVEEFFAVKCFEIDKRLGEPAGCRHFLTWFDETPRKQMRRELLKEVKRTLTARKESA